MTLPLELGQVEDAYARRALEQISLKCCSSADRVPAGGSAGQVLVKNSDANYDTVWADPGGAFAFFNG